MENDYLWDKNGGDAEIERFESLLSGFKYEAMPPPRLPVAVIVDQPRSNAWWKFTLAFAVPACLLVALGFAFWAMGTGGEKPTLNAQTEINSPSLIEREINREVVKPETELVEPEITKPLEAKIEKTIFTPRTRSLAPRSMPAKHRPVPKQSIETLTAEEKFAYGQLKLALSITGSKLKVVSDTVNRAED